MLLLPCVWFTGIYNENVTVMMLSSHCAQFMYSVPLLKVCFCKCCKCCCLLKLMLVV